jgi:hypothetical protein
METLHSFQTIKQFVKERFPSKAKDLNKKANDPGIVNYVNNLVLKTEKEL